MFSRRGGPGAIWEQLPKLDTSGVHPRIGQSIWNSRTVVFVADPHVQTAITGKKGITRAGLPPPIGGFTGPARNTFLVVLPGIVLLMPFNSGLTFAKEEYPGSPRQLRRGGSERPRKSTPHGLTSRVLALSQPAQEDAPPGQTRQLLLRARTD